jgi:hypothetical protein
MEQVLHALRLYTQPASWRQRRRTAAAQIAAVDVTRAAPDGHLWQQQQQQQQHKNGWIASSSSAASNSCIGSSIWITFDSTTSTSSSRFYSAAAMATLTALPATAAVAPSQQGLTLQQTRQHSNTRCWSTGSNIVR